MSILTDLFEGKITFSQAASEGGQWFSNILTHAPAVVQTDVANAESAFKQAASNAIALADTAIAPYILTASKGIESLVDAAMDGATGGIATPLNPLVNSGIDQIAAALKAEIDAGAAKAKAKLAKPAS